MLRPPTQSFHFIVSFGEEFRILTEQTVSIQVDFQSRVINLVIRDSIDNEAAKALDEWLAEPIAVYWCVGASVDEIVRSHLFSDITVREHIVGQTYTSADVVLHDIRLSFEDCETSYA